MGRGATNLDLISARPFNGLRVENFRARIREAIDRVNRDLSVTEKIRGFAFADEPFTIENEQLTPSMKIRRHKIREVYGERLDALYRS